MLENPNGKTKLKFQIAFGNLKKDFKDNYYLATEERAVENRVATCAFIAEKEKNKYAVVIKDVMGVEVARYINLNYFEEWHYVKII
jgi:hypothetical protein